MSRTLALATAALVAGPFAAAAPAADFNVATGAQLSTALSTAASNGTADRVLLAAGSYAGPFAYNSAEGLEVIGAGQATTTITQAGSATGLFLQHANATYRVADVGFAVNGSAGNGLRIAGAGVVERVAATVVAGSNANAISLGRAGIALREATIQGASGGSGVVYNAAGASTISDSTISGGGINVQANTTGGNLTLARVRLLGPTNEAVAANFGATVTITDSLIDLGTTDGFALIAGDSNNAGGANTSAVVASRVTIVGDGVHHQGGVVIVPNTVGDNFSVALHDSVLTGLDAGPLICSQTAAGTGAITTDYSSVPADGNFSDCTPGITQTHPVATANLHFLDAAAQDYRLRYDSALVDAGDPAALAATTDLGRLPRPINGIRDVGAHEYQRNAPVATAAGVPATVTVGQAVAYTGSATDADPGETPALAWAFDDGGSAAGAAATHAFATPGSHTATLTATDPAGAVGTAQVVVTVVAAAGPPVPVVPSADVTAPVITRAAVRGRLARFVLSEAAAVTVTLERRVGRRYQRVSGRFRMAGAKAGANRLHFPAKRFRTLRPGRYRATFVARDAAGNVSQRVRKRFSVRRPR
jgi:hypothetical protein